MMTFPLQKKFHRYMHVKRQRDLPNITQFIKSSKTKEEFINQLQEITLREINRIELRTRRQSKNHLWTYYRHSIVTGTLTKRINRAAIKNENSERLNYAIAKTQPRAMWYPAVVWGRTNEYKGINAFIKEMRSTHINLTAHEVGLKLDSTHPFIGGSVDAKLTCDCCPPAILEIKCPFSIKDSDVKTDGYQLSYLDENLELRKGHDYYFQLQTYLGIYNYDVGYFCIWTTRGVHIQRILLDREFWSSLKTNICTYYFAHYLKHLD